MAAGFLGSLSSSFGQPPDVEASPPTGPSARAIGPSDQTTRPRIPLPPLRLPPEHEQPSPTSLPYRPLVLTLAGTELELRGRFSRSHFSQTRPIPPFAPLILDTTQRTETLVLSLRRRLGRDFELALELPRHSLREAQPSRVPAAATSNEAIQEQFFTSRGLGDVQLRVSKQFCARLAPMTSQAVDLSVKLATGSASFPVGTALLSPGTGQKDWTVGYRGKRQFRSWTGTLGVHRTLRERGPRMSSDGTVFDLRPGDRWRFAARGDRAFRRWLIGSIELVRIQSERAQLSGAVVAGTAQGLWTLEPSVTLSITDDVEAVLAAELPIDHRQDPSDGAYTMGVRWRI